MPDGGDDCCANCVFNAHWGSYHDPEREGNREWAADCVLRGIRTDDPFWTYCDWFHGWSLAAMNPPFRRDVQEIIENRPSSYRLDGDRVRDLVVRVLAYLAERRQSFPPVMANGLGGRGHYGRIPWDGPNQPFAGAGPGVCDTCCSHSERTVGISPTDYERQLLFCSDDCYLSWWRMRHPDPPDWRGGPRVVAGRP